MLLVELQFANINKMLSTAVLSIMDGLNTVIQLDHILHFQCGKTSILNLNAANNCLNNDPQNVTFRHFSLECLLCIILQYYKGGNN